MHGLVRDAEAVGSHVGDQADGPGAVDVDALVELLGDLHGPLAREPQADRGLLLERAGLERGVGLVELLGLVDLGDDVAAEARASRIAWASASVLASNFAAVVLGQGGLEPVGSRRRARRADGRGDLPVFLGDEGPDLALAVDDQADGDRLDPAALRLRATFFQSSGLSW